MEGKKLDFNVPLLSVRVNRKIREIARPNRQHSLPLYKSDWELTEVAKPAAVPFVWEHTPGRPKDGSKTKSQPPEEPSITPRFPPGKALDAIKRVSGEQFDGRTAFRPQIEAPPLNEIVEGICVKEDSSQSEDEAYSDALDTLSATESFSWDCSVSGLSGCDGPDAKSCGTFSADPQTRDFMMTRFLPAARAMVIEMPQYVPRKQPVVSEQPRHMKKFVSGELRPLFERYGSNTALHYSQYKGNVENEDDEYANRGRQSDKACGFLPWICVKNSLCLLDPVPGMKSRGQSPISSACEVRRMARTVYSGPLPQTHEKHDWKNIQSGVQSRELVENKLIGTSNQFHHSSDSYITEGLSPHRRSRGGGISPYRNEKPQSPFHDGARFLGIPKEIKNIEVDKFSSISKMSDKFRDVSSNQIYKQGSGSVSTIVEKTLYIDSVNKVEGKGMEEFSTAKSFTRGERIVKPKALGSLNEDLPSSPCISNLKGKADRIEGLRYDQEARSLQCLIVHPKENLEMKNENTIKVNDQGNSNVGSLQSPRPPPLPKSPSESWLWHTLPSISLPNSFSQVQPKQQGHKSSTTGAKWETIVKTSNVRHDRVRYSEELISHVSQHFKT